MYIIYYCILIIILYFYEYSTFYIFYYIIYHLARGVHGGLLQAARRSNPQGSKAFGVERSFQVPQDVWDEAKAQFRVRLREIEVGV